MAPTTEQQILVEQRVTNEAKSMIVAYLLLFFLGALGAHRFYLGKTGTAVAMLIMSIIGFVTIIVGIGLFFFAVVYIWVFVDIFLIPSIVKADRDRLRQTLLTQV